MNLLLALAAQAFPDESSQGAAHERSADEDPDVRERLTADEEGGAEGTGPTAFA